MSPRGRTLAVAAGLLALVACGDGGRGDGPEGARPPAVDALISAGDSVYWLRSDSSGLRLRGVAMTLARVDGRFQEVYTVEDDHSFYDALFVGQAVFRRDLEAGDSVQVIADTLMPRLARAYQAAHPRERPLRPDEEANEYARTVATVEYTDFTLHGPYLSLAYRADIDVIGGVSSRDTRWLMVDLRDGRPATATSLFGRQTAAMLLRAARADLAAAGEPGAWRLDEASLLLDGSADTVLVTFEALATDPSYGDATLALTPIAVPAPDWWRAAAAERPVPRDPGYRAEQPPVALLFAAPEDDGRVALTLVDAEGHAWDAGRITGDPSRVHWLDSTVTPEARLALTRAFDDAALYSGDARIVRGPAPRPRMRPTLVSLARHTPPSPRRHRR
jgi:hypothetical protein